MKTILYIQPSIMYYRLPFIKALAKNFDKVYVYHSPQTKKNIVIKINNVQEIKHKILFFFNKTVNYHLNTVKTVQFVKPDIVFTGASLRTISTYFLLTYCYFKKIPIFLHGHGLFKSSFLSKRIILKYFFLPLCSKYICYNNLVKKSFIQNGIANNKLYVFNNTIYLQHINSYKNKTYKEKGILFIGRLRDKTGLELLITAIQSVRSRYKIILHVIGGGKNLQYFKKKYSNLNWVVWHGEIYDESKIKKIGKNCRIGAYLGYSGLSIVHYLALSLPVMLKKSLIEHEGPENYYCNKKNSFRVNIKTSNQIEKKISYIWSLSNYILQKYGKCGFDTYLKISNRKFLITLVQKILNKNFLQ